MATLLLLLLLQPHHYQSKISGAQILAMNLEILACPHIRILISTFLAWCKGICSNTFSISLAAESFLSVVSWYHSFIFMSWKRKGFWAKNKRMSLYTNLKDFFRSGEGLNFSFYYVLLLIPIVCVLQTHLSCMVDQQLSCHHHLA